MGTPKQPGAERSEFNRNSSVPAAAARISVSPQFASGYPESAPSVYPAGRASSSSFSEIGRDIGLDERLCPWNFARAYRVIRRVTRLACKEAQMERDPVCGMEVEATATAPTAEYGGRTYYFCSEACRQQFEEAPHQYATKEAA